MKVLLIGSPGAGKSTLALQLAEELQLPILHLDKLWHATDYSAAARERFRQEIEAFMASHDSWLIDGNYANRLPQRLAQADHVIWLDYSRWLCCYRVIKRSLLTRLFRAKRPDMAEQFKECFDREYLDFLQFVWSFQKTTTPKIEQALAHFSGTVYRYHQPVELTVLLQALQQREGQAARR